MKHVGHSAEGSRRLFWSMRISSCVSVWNFLSPLFLVSTWVWDPLSLKSSLLCACLICIKRLVFCNHLRSWMRRKPHVAFLSLLKDMVLCCFFKCSKRCNKACFLNSVLYHVPMIFYSKLYMNVIYSWLLAWGNSSFCISILSYWFLHGRPNWIWNTSCAVWYCTHTKFT